MYESKKEFFYGTGRRKKSIARVRLYPGTGAITINDRDIDEFFGLDTLKLIVRQPLELTKTTGKFDVICRVEGGGVSGQAGAIRHGDCPRAAGGGCKLPHGPQSRRLPHERPENERAQKIWPQGCTSRAAV